MLEEWCDEQARECCRRITEQQKRCWEVSDETAGPKLTVVQAEHPRYDK